MGKLLGPLAYMVHKMTTSIIVAKTGQRLERNPRVSYEDLVHGEAIRLTLITHSSAVLLKLHPCITTQIYLDSNYMYTGD